MKKLISVVLCFILLFSSVCMASAGFDNSEYNGYPVIVVPGYSSSAQYRIDENGNKVHVWGVDMNEILAALFKNIVKVGIDIGALATGDGKALGETVGKEFVKLYYDMACNPDGSSVYPLQRYCVTAEESNRAVMLKKYDGELTYQHETEILGEYAKYIGDENIYNFNCDFRMGAPFCAKQLDEFIQSVKEYSGKDKVNIFAVSHGGQVTGTYLTLYGEKGDVNNAVMTVPALGGAGIVYDLLADNIEFDEECLLRFVEHGMMFETDFNWLVRANELGFLDEVLNTLAPYARQVLGYWGSIWDFCPTEFYEEMKAKNLDPVESAELIKKSDYMHYEVMPDFSNGFKRAQKAGTDVYIVAGYDNKVVTGLNQSSDGIITINSATGATAAPLGQRFSDGYTQKVDTGFYQVSPSMTVDASTSYLPNHTWFIENFFHGMIYKDPYTAQLLKTLLLTEKIKDVHSSAQYPQFHATTNKSHSVHAMFNNSTEGYVSSKDTAVVIKNLSEKYKMKITSISARGLDIKFAGSIFTKVLKPGESVEVKFTGKIPELSLANFDLVVDYTLIGSATPLGERLFNFTIMNGDAVKYDPEKPYVSANLVSDFNKLLDEDSNNILTKTGSKTLFEMLYNIIWPFAKYIIDFVRIIKGH